MAAFPAFGFRAGVYGAVITALGWPLTALVWLLSGFRRRGVQSPGCLVMVGDFEFVAGANGAFGYGAAHPVALIAERADHR